MSHDQRRLVKETCSMMNVLSNMATPKTTATKRRRRKTRKE